jgi:type IV pilus assembly protein PilV
MSKPFSLPPPGFTLLEILIAIVVLSFGLMGLAGIQAVGIKNTHSANLRTLAIQQAYDMADRMRANADGVISGQYSALPATLPATIPADPGCISTGCSSSQLRDYDQRLWNLNNSAMLPSGTGGVVLATGATIPNKRYIITVMWDDNRTGATGLGCGGNPTVDLTCFQVIFRP